MEWPNGDRPGARPTTAEDLGGVLHCWTRLNILLAFTGPRRDARATASLLHISPNLLSTHAHSLERLGLVTMERQGQHVYWSLLPTAVIAVDHKEIEFRLLASDGGRASQSIPFTSAVFRLLEPAIRASGIEVPRRPSKRKADQDLTAKPTPAPARGRTPDAPTAPRLPT
jgi:DNA-binding transcriptional ArsR family regulator